MRESDEKEQVSELLHFNAIDILTYRVQLLVQLQNKEQTITELTEENDHLSSALNTAEGRLAEMYMEQTRQEEETAARLEVMEKLRIQARELEREKRELQRRYNEQVRSTSRAEIHYPAFLFSLHRRQRSRQSDRPFTTTNSISSRAYNRSRLLSPRLASSSNISLSHPYSRRPNLRRRLKKRRRPTPMGRRTRPSHLMLRKTNQQRLPH